MKFVSEFEAPFLITQHALHCTTLSTALHCTTPTTMQPHHSAVFITLHPHYSTALHSPHCTTTTPRTSFHPHYSTTHNSTVQCSALHFTSTACHRMPLQFTVWRSAAPYTALYFTTFYFHCTALHCTVQRAAWQCISLHCTSLHGAAHCIALYFTTLHHHCTRHQFPTMCSTGVQFTARCSALHYTEPHYIVLYCMYYTLFRWKECICTCTAIMTTASRSLNLDLNEGCHGDIYSENRMTLLQHLINSSMAIDDIHDHRAAE